MKYYKNQPILICYPAGGGGSFITGLLKSIEHKSDIIVDHQTGNCHQYRSQNLPFVSGDSIESFKSEIFSLDQIDFTKIHICQGHYRNLIYAQQKSFSQGTSVFFVKVDFDPCNENHLKFLTEMLIRKTERKHSLSSEKLVDFKEGSYYSYRSWYWIENHFTKQNTISISINDLFIGSIIPKLKPILNDETMIQKALKYHNTYKKINHELHGDLIKLLN